MLRALIFCVLCLVVQSYWVSTLLGDGTDGHGDGVGTNAAVDHPSDMIFHPNQSYVLIADKDNHIIREYNVATNTLTTIAGRANNPGYYDATGTDAQFSKPNGIAYHPIDNYVIITDRDNHRIRKMDMSTLVVTTLAGNGEAWADGTGTNAQFNKPWGVIFSPSRAYIFIADQDNHRLRKMAIATNAVTTIAGSGTAGDSNGVGTAATLNKPCSLILSSDELYIIFADSKSNVIRKIEISTNTVSDFCGTNNGGAFNNGACAGAEFDNPQGIARAPDGMIYVSDTDNHRIRLIDPVTMTVELYAGQASFGADDGPRLDAKFQKPQSIAIAPDGTYALIGDKDNQLIRKLLLYDAPSGSPSSAPSALPTGIPTSLPSSSPTSIPTSAPSGVPTGKPTAVPTSIPTSVPTSPTSIPTSIPSACPTSQPSSCPTTSPTSIPTALPSSIPTSVPTSAPSCSPTAAPSSVPTSLPSAAPTSIPTGLPSAPPTSVPSGEPTAIPTSQPTAQPTSIPSSKPSSVPTSLPSSSPTSVPTSLPTSSPSSIPSSAPSSLPTSLPTSQPTAVPTALPSGVPTSLPSSLPSSIPTAVPSTVPSSVPSSSPTSSPTSLPSSVPSCQPTSLPTAIPTSQPTAQPTSIPSSKPSSVPTSLPSSSPTSVPTSLPTSLPSSVPSSSPSSVPSSIPTSQPSSLPTSLPTSSPSSIPSSAPSSLPTSLPTSQPTAVPTALPSGVPTSPPSSLPSSIPTAVPSTVPSSVPSSSPTSSPTSLPSSVPSSLPTSLPTSLPSSVPSSAPSSVPSSIPTSQPSSLPTSLPTSLPSSIPSSAPSSLPTSLPTSQPSVSPSSLPSSLPSAWPSAMPSSQPSSVPSSLPTAVPTQVPTSVPSSLPTSVPSSDPTSIPSSVPTTVPTALPSSCPSAVPTSLPSTVPTTIPTSLPSTPPTSCPTANPTFKPTPFPTGAATFGDIGLNNVGNFGFGVYGLTEQGLGQTVESVSDVNNDGIDDFIIGAPFSNNQVGAAYVIYGRDGGSPDIYLSALNHKQGFALYGDASRSGAFGYAASGVGDVNSDGVGDFVVSSPFADGGVGEVYVIFGRAGYRDNMYMNEFQTPAQGFKIFGSVLSGNAGYAVSGVGDVNGDGVADMMLSAPYVDEARGRVYLIYGQVVGNAADINLATASASRVTVIQGSVAKSRSGFSVTSVGDANGDGRPDFAIGEPQAVTNVRGAVRVVFGCSNNCFGGIDLSNLGVRGFSVIGPSDYAKIGSTVSAAGDINSDGYSDFIVGSFIANNFKGAAYVIYGKADSTTVDLATLDKSRGFKILGTGNGHFGMSVAGLMDINHDRIPDMVVGNPSATNQMRAYAVMGSQGLLFSGTADMSTLSARDYFGLTTLQSNDEAGKVVSSVGDFNGDGFVDFAVSAPRSTNDDGAVYVVYNATAAGVWIELTHAPVCHPTPYPTVTPTAVPTLFPTSWPTLIPTAPTYNPTTQPTRAPNKTPWPTFYPSAFPTVAPTSSPTFRPTSLPTRYPTSQPTSKPSEAPTLIPSSSTPTNSPTDQPSYAPNQSPVPTAPSPQPTRRPTRNPTLEPTEQPTSNPSNAPTASPTVPPTMFPTLHPTSVPTPLPSVCPSGHPSAQPSRAPSSYPTTSDGYVKMHVSKCEEYSGTYDDNHFYVDVEPHCEVVLAGVAGSNIYTINPSASSRITVVDFQLDSDIIDLRAFADIRSFRDINMTRGSVRIHLPEGQTIILLQLDPADMTSDQFLLLKSNRQSSSVLKLGALEIALAIIMFFVGVYLVHRIKMNWEEDMYCVQDCAPIVKKCIQWKKSQVKEASPNSKEQKFDVEKGLDIIPTYQVNKIYPLSEAHAATSDSTHSECKEELPRFRSSQERATELCEEGLLSGPDTFTMEAFDQLMGFSSDSSDVLGSDSWGSSDFDESGSESDSNMYGSISSVSDVEDWLQ